MPPLGLHMTVARELAAVIASSRIEADRGGYYPGATTPDIRVLTRMDRLLQLHLDRREREDGCAVAEIRDALTRTAVEVAVDFIGRDTLLEWRDWQIELISTAPRFEKMMVRHLHAVGIEGEEAISRFFEEHSDELLRDTIERVGEERIRDYLSTAKAKARRAMTEYLS